MPNMRDQGTLDSLLRDVAKRLQLPASKHEVAERQFRAITDHIDREGSPLEGLVVQAYPSGSFAIHAAIASRVRSEQYDVDIVVELAVHENADPEQILQLTFEAINGTIGTRYHGKVRLNSRCVTVEYEDGVSIDVMPVARRSEPLERASNLFHYKKKTGETYQKPVNPYGFAFLYNKAMGGTGEVGTYRRRLAGGLVTAAEAEPLPPAMPFDVKPLRTLALQLIKRNRTILYRNRDGMRCPPSVVLAGLSLNAGPQQGTLVDELLNVARTVREAIETAEGQGALLRVENPAFLGKDVFTDRWPEDRAAQRLYSNDLRRLIVSIQNLLNSDFDAVESKAALEALFGEAASEYAIDEYFTRQEVGRKSGLIGVGQGGKVGLVGTSVAGTVIAPVRANTNMGGHIEEL